MQAIGRLQQQQFELTGLPTQEWSILYRHQAELRFKLSSGRNREHPARLDSCRAERQQATGGAESVNAMFEKEFTDLVAACAFADAIVETVREPMLVLDAELRVVVASRAFYARFKVTAEDTQGKLFYELGDGQWDIPELHALLEKIVPEKGVMDDYEVAHEFPGIGQRTMLLNARQVFYETDKRTHILLGIEDITSRRILEREKDNLLQQKDVLLHEMQHRVANSLQIIASIIMLKAKAVKSEEVRHHLQDAHKRVISVAAVQQHLHASVTAGSVDAVEVKSYLTTLCEALATSMIAEGRSISLNVRGESGSVNCRDAESLGLITTELVINSLKHAFGEEVEEGQITVAFDVSGTNWKLSVADNGVGRPDGTFAQAKSGLGTGIVSALAKQLDAKLDTVSGPAGTTVSVTHATFSAKKLMPFHVVSERHSPASPALAS